MFSLIKNDEKRLGLVSIELWTRHGNVVGWSPCLNSATAYPSYIIKLLPLGIEVKCSRTGVQGEFIFDQDTLVEFSNQDSIHSSSSSSRSRTYATVSRTIRDKQHRGSTQQDSVSSLLVAEALTLQSGLLTS
ncbi:unnamed protein product [Brassica oleracea var. botrytis]|uniref:(rape) hypothetical protein n=1 Tax=Brassica napus TaxID=3708 RepID=A0A816QQ84_BRANA|nr:unnamed protein product [Brassica napus]